MLASESLPIPRSSRSDWFDTIVDVDTELFVDPFLVFKETTGRWAGAHDRLVEHFNGAFMLIAEGNLNPQSLAYRKALGLLLFREPRELCLGYTAKGTRGAGSGEGFARIIADAIVAAIERGLEHPRHFEELGILQEGIGADRISDISCTILKPELVAYTQQIAKRGKVPLAAHRVYAAAFDEDRRRFLSPEVEVPTNPATGGPLLFVPKRFLSELPKLNADDWWNQYENEQLRNDLNYEVMGKVKKQVIVETARANLGSVRAWSKAQEGEDGEPYDFPRDPKGVYQWELATADFTAQNPLAIAPASSEAEFESVIERVIESFRLFVEDQRGWYLLWDGLNEKPELAPQLLFYGIARNYCTANNIVIDREIELGRGPVDFKFSNGYAHRAHLEVKKLHSGKFWNGLDRQLPSYMESDDVQKAWFMAVRYREGSRWDQRERELPGRVQAAGRAHERDLRSALIDARPPNRSASQL